MMPTIGVKLRVFVPKTVFNMPRVQQEIQHVMLTKTRMDLRRELWRGCRSWKHQPNWQMPHYFGVRVMWVKVFTYSTQYRLVNAGTTKKDYPIVPRRKNMLRFQTQFRPKTRPRLLGSFVGGKFGPYISTLAVIHPGFEAREFDKTVAEEYQKNFTNDIQRAINEGIIHA